VWYVCSYYNVFLFLYFVIFKTVQKLIRELEKASKRAQDAVNEWQKEKVLRVDHESCIQALREKICFNDEVHKRVYCTACCMWVVKLHSVPDLCIIRLHRSTTYVDAACCYRLSSMVCRSVYHTNKPCKNGCTDQDAVWVEDSGGPREPCIRWGS